MIAWYICPYKTIVERGQPLRYCAMDDFTSQIYPNGSWAETEILGDRAIVKVNTTPAIISTLDSTFKRIPKDRLNDSLSDLPNGIKTSLKNEILDAGYTLQEIQNVLGSDLGAITLRDVLRFMTRRRLKPRYDSLQGKVVCDGEIHPCRDIDDVDRSV